MRLGIVADDNTGASDSAGMLAQRGVRTALVFDPAVLRRERARLAAFDAVVLGTQIRSVAPRLAAARTREAVRLLRAAGCRTLQVKYCSTFDSTPEGNIGPSLDAALDAAGAACTVVCPSLPVNGRTTYCGHLFVHGVPLAESSLRNHPLNPMTDSNLVRWLQRQTRRRVGRVGLADVRCGPGPLRRRLEELCREGWRYLVVDAIADEDLLALASAARGWPVLSGASGLTDGLGAVLFPRRRLRSFARRLAGLRPRTLAISGSMSEATRAQNRRALRAGFAGVALDGARLLHGAAACAGAVGQARAWLVAGRDVLVYSRAESAQDVRRTQRVARRMGLSPVAAGERIADALARVAAELASAPQVGILVVSGGETSGAVCRGVGLTLLECGLPIAPGVPYCFPDNRPGLAVVLKSGNFGGERFYEEVRRIRGQAGTGR